MFLDTSGSHNADDFIAALFPACDARGHYWIRHDDQVLPYAAELSPIRLSNIRVERTLAVSAARFSGAQILPNFSSTYAVTISLSAAKIKGVQTPKHLYELISNQLGKNNIPLPSALVASPRTCHVVWIVDDPFMPCDLGELFQIEKGLTKALAAFTSQQHLGSATRVLELPTATTASTLRVAIISNGAIRTVSRSRLYQRACSDLTCPEAEGLRRSSEGLCEIGDLLFSRINTTAQYSERYWIWIALFAGTCQPFSARDDLSSIIRSAAESLENAPWELVKNRPMRFHQDTYSGYEATLIRFLKDGAIRIGNIFQIAEAEWLSTGADLLGVTEQEVTNLQLKHLRPIGTCAKPLTRRIARNSRPLGYCHRNTIDLFAHESLRAG